MVVIILVNLSNVVDAIVVLVIGSIVVHASFITVICTVMYVVFNTDIFITSD